jgi:hypothetical protein
MVSMGGIFDAGLTAANKVIAANTARVAAAAAAKAASAVHATNPNAPAAPAAGIPTPVIIGGIAAVGLVLVLAMSKKKKR